MNTSNNKKTPPAVGRRSEVLRYAVFGVLTTVVSLVTNFALLWSCKALWGISDTDSAAYYAIFTAAKIFSWVCAVLFAFFTNKKWVFFDNVRGGAGVSRQLAVFAGGRLLTLGLDYLLNIVFLWLAAALSLSILDGLLGFSLNQINELAAWLATQVFVVIVNYFLSKWFVFRKNRG